MEPGYLLFKELILGTFEGKAADAFLVRLGPRGLDRILHRMEVFRQCRALDPGLREMVYKDALGGCFIANARAQCSGDGPAPAGAPVVVADEMVICDFAEDLAQGRKQVDRGEAGTS